MSTESVTLDRFVGGCYIIGAKLMMRALQGKPWGALFFGLRLSPLLVFLVVAGVRTPSLSYSAIGRRSDEASPRRALRPIGRILGCPFA